MTTNQISATLDQTNRDAMMAAIATLKEKLPFLIDLTAQRKSLPKMGDKSRAFVSKALEVATQNPDFLPWSFDLEEMRQDVELFESLYPILLSLTQLHELVGMILVLQWAVMPMQRRWWSTTLPRQVERVQVWMR